MTDVPEPVFEQPWHAQVFALTVHLNETGQLAWTDWADRFSATLKHNGLTRDLNGGEDYFQAWLETLEGFLEETGALRRPEMRRMKRDWEQAYLNTPHGAPVKLSP